MSSLFSCCLHADPLLILQINSLWYGGKRMERRERREGIGRGERGEDNIDEVWCPYSACYE